MENKKKMVNDYKAAVGVWKHELGDITHELVPEENDNYKFLEAKDEAEKKKDGTIIHRRVGEIYLNMVKRANPTLTEQEIKHVKTWIGVNVNKIVEDFLIAFNWTSKEGLENIKKKFDDQSPQTK